MVIDGHPSVLVGSSGVGKSTFINCLFNQDIQKTQNISERHKEGLHTITKRSLLYLDEQTCVIDMPGMRSISSYTKIGDNPIIEQINAYTVDCTFSDCNHLNNKGCRVLETLALGEITQEAYAFYLKHQKVDAYYQEHNLNYHREKVKAVKQFEKDKRLK